MNKMGTNHKSSHLASLASMAGLVSLVLAVALSPAGGVAMAAPMTATSPGLGASASYSVLAGSTVTCTGSTTTNGDVGVSQGTSITGFPSPCVAGPPGTTHSNDASAIAAQADNLAVFGLLDQTCDQSFGAVDLTATFPAGVGPGVYCSTSSFSLSGNLNLTGTGVWIFKTVTTLITSPGSSVTGGDPCNVWWRIGSSATVDTTTPFIGSIFALTDINLLTGATLNGRALAQTGQVTLQGNTITGPNCSGAGGGASHVSVSYVCIDDGRVQVTVGLSAGVTVFGLGADITSAQDTGENRIVRLLPAGRYEWRAVAPGGNYMLDVDHGVVDAALCTPAAIAAAAALTPGPAATAAAATASAASAVLIPATGADPAEERAFASRQSLRIGLGALGLSLVLLGFTLRRKKAE